MTCAFPPLTLGCAAAGLGLAAALAFCHHLRRLQRRGGGSQEAGAPGVEAGQPGAAATCWPQACHKLAGPQCSTPCGRSQVEDHFARLIQRTSPKSQAQARGEVRVTRKFLENFSGDQVGARRGARGGGVGPLAPPACAVASRHRGAAGAGRGGPTLSCPTEAWAPRSERPRTYLS